MPVQSNANLGVSDLLLGVSFLLASFLRRQDLPFGNLLLQTIVIDLKPFLCLPYINFRQIDPTPINLCLALKILFFRSSSA